MTKLFIISGSLGSRKAIAKLASMKVTAEIRNLNSQKITLEEFKEMLSLTEEGAMDLIATKSNDYKKLVESGVDFEELKLSELHELILSHPRLIKAPIILGKNKAVFGYDEHEYDAFTPRKKRIQKIESSLKKIRKMENKEFGKNLDKNTEVLI